jgi:hypothetical protein
MRPVKITVLMLMAFFTSEMALAQPPARNPERQIQEVLKTVQLDPEQKAKVRQIRESSRNRLQGLREELDKSRRALVSLAAAGMMAFVNFMPMSEPEAWLEADDLIYRPEVQDRGSYQDWLWITDQVVDEAEE